MDLGLGDGYLFVNVLDIKGQYTLFAADLASLG
jgi:hypothetical protein